MLGETEVADYREQGYIAPVHRFAEGTLTRMRESADRLVQAHPEWSDFCPELLAQDPLWLEIASQPELLDVVSQLIGDDIVLWGSGYFGKPAGVGKTTPWHQDGEYWPIRPLRTVTAWVALDPVTSENGCLRVIPGSHRRKELFVHDTNDSEELTLNQVIKSEAFNEANAADIILDLGEVSVHDVYMIHGSLSNRSSKRRAAVTFRYMPASCHFDRKLAAGQHANFKVPDLSQRPLYLLRGEDKNGMNEYYPAQA